jgi:aminoglycoside phosphotransferase (APT) family kinase protein
MTEGKLGKRIGGGWTAQIYAWGNDRVLKLFESWVPLDWVNHEARAMQLAKKSGLPVPAIDEVISHENRNGIVMERIEGPSMGAAMFSRFWKTNYYARVLAELQVAVNSQKAPEFEPMRSRLETTIRNETAIPKETKEATLQILQKLLDGEALCHFDIHPLNIIMSRRGPVIIDWTGAGKGDPTADVARTWLLCTLAPIPMPMPISGVLNAWLRHFYAEYLKEYTRLAAISQETLELWKIPILAERIPSEKSDARKAFLLKVLEKQLERVGGGKH